MPPTNMPTTTKMNRLLLVVVILLLALLAGTVAGFVIGIDTASLTQGLTGGCMVVGCVATPGVAIWGVWVSAEAQSTARDDGDPRTAEHPPSLPTVNTPRQRSARRRRSRRRDGRSDDDPPAARSPRSRPPDRRSRAGSPARRTPRGRTSLRAADPA